MNYRTQIDKILKADLRKHQAKTIQHKQHPNWDQVFQDDLVGEYHEAEDCNVMNIFRQNRVSLILMKIVSLPKSIIICTKKHLP